jgi:hypothetical protein
LRAAVVETHAHRAGFHVAAADDAVAQIGNLLYRRLAVGRT